LFIIQGIHGSEMSLQFSFFKHQLVQNLPLYD